MARSIIAVTALLFLVTFSSASATFMVSTDSIAPTIVHSALTSTVNTAGPYRVCAQVTDDRALGEITLHWKKNGAAYVSVPMTPSGAPDEYCANIPGPSVIGDTYSYYIEAKDASIPANTQVEPWSQLGAHSFNIGSCGAQIMANPGGGVWGYQISYGNGYRCTKTARLTRIEEYYPNAPSWVTFTVYESMAQSGTFTKIYEGRTTQSSPGWCGTGPISVMLQAGRYYGMLAVTDASHTYSYVHALPTAFGECLGGIAFTSYPPPQTVQEDIGGASIYCQRISTCRIPGTVSLVWPNGGESIEPGSVVVVRWSCQGSDWLPGDRVRLEFSSDGGTTWQPIPGAANLPYGDGTFAWDTTGLSLSPHCKVRVTYNGDDTVTDASDAAFALEPDTVPCAIAHVPPEHTADLAGPYRICASVTDNARVRSVTLVWSKNAGDFQSLPMNPSGTSDEYSADLPGPGSIGDLYRYYIEAVDGHGNVTKTPAGAPAGFYTLDVTTSVTNTIASASSSTTITAGGAGNGFLASSDAWLTQIEQYLNIPTLTEITFFVCENSGTGPSTRIFEKIIPNSGTGAKWYGTGPINVKLKRGYYYDVGTASRDRVYYYYNSFGQSPDFGNLMFGDGGFWVWQYPPLCPGVYPDNYVFYQRLTDSVAPRNITLNGPPGSFFEPGDVVCVYWYTVGPGWHADDTVRFEYSSDGGETWNQVAGAESLPYNQNSFYWDTSGYAPSTNYLIRVVQNGDSRVTDVSNFTFTIGSDTQPPTIEHTPIADNAILRGPYDVRATVRDNYGIADVTLYWRQNGGEWIAGSEENGGYWTIPGPSHVGDQYDYYIVAKDKSDAGNTTTHPAGAPGNYHSFRILECAPDVLGLETPGFPSLTYTQAGGAGNYYQCTVESTLTQIEHYLKIDTSTSLRFLVYEATSQNGTYHRIHLTTVASSGTGEGWYSSGPISVKLVAGRYYVVGAFWTNSSQGKGITMGHPFLTAFGNSFSGYNTSYSSPPTSVTYHSSQYVYQQRLSSCILAREVTLTQPYGGQRYLTGASVVIGWQTDGICWLESDTVRVEYSSDGGLTWSQIAGAESIPYSSGAFTWDTSACLDSTHYRVRVVCNADERATDSSHADFSILVDRIPPVITHTALKDTASIYSRSVTATITDDYAGVGQATLYWSKNGGAFTPVSMSKSGSNYYGSMPAGVTDDTYRYYIEATDSANPSNVARSPQGTGYYQYCIVDWHTQSFGTNSFNLESLAITFTPDGTCDGYATCSKRILTLPTDPAGGTEVALPDEGFSEVTLANGALLPFFGSLYNKCYVCSNGSVTFDQGDSSSGVYMSDHFRLKRISGFFANLNPALGGSVSYRQTSDRLAVTYSDVPLSTASTMLHTFQIEMFFDGRISLSYLRADPGTSIVGLSAGQGNIEAPTSSLSSAPVCSTANVEIDDTLQPSSDRCLPFGLVAVGSSRTARVTLRNQGPGELILNGVDLPSHSENFDDQLAQGWVSQNEYGTWDVLSGQYRLTSNKYWYLPYASLSLNKSEVFDDFYCRADMLPGSTESQCLVLRASSDFDMYAGSGYVFGVTPAYGSYSIFKRVGGVATTITPVTYSPFVVPQPRWNTAAVNAVGPTLQFYLNGFLVTTVSDSSLTSGYMGLAVDPGKSLTPSSFFDNVLLARPIGRASASGFSLSGLPTLPCAIPPGQTVGFDVTYAPQAMGEACAEIFVSSPESNEPTIKLVLSGTGASVEGIGMHKRLVEGASVAMSGKRVSAVFDDRFYVQDDERSSGIGVLWSGDKPAPGKLVTFDGTLESRDGELLILGGNLIVDTADPVPPAPLYLNNTSLGGGGCGYSPGPPPTGQEGIAGSRGLDNIGLLVRVSGNVTQMDPAGHYFYIDDGSGVKDGSRTGAEENLGIRVAHDGTGYERGQFVVVTGISSCFKSGDGKLLRQVRVLQEVGIQHVTLLKPVSEPMHAY